MEEKDLLKLFIIYYFDFERKILSKNKIFKIMNEETYKYLYKEKIYYVVIIYPHLIKEKKINLIEKFLEKLIERSKFEFFGIKQKDKKNNKTYLYILTNGDYHNEYIIKEWNTILKLNQKDYSVNTKIVKNITKTMNYLIKKNGKYMGVSKGIKRFIRKNIYKFEDINYSNINLEQFKQIIQSKIIKKDKKLEMYEKEFGINKEIFDELFKNEGWFKKNKEKEEEKNKKKRREGTKV